MHTPLVTLVELLLKIGVRENRTGNQEKLITLVRQDTDEDNKNAILKTKNNLVVIHQWEKHGIMIMTN